MTQDLTNDSAWLSMFLDFIGSITIDSKESGVTNLRKKLYSAQFRLLEQMDDGMRDGVRMFVILKARQLGISTISLALDLFWLMVFPGMQGAIVTDTEPNRDKFRILIDRYWESIPQKMKGNIRLVKNNRSNLVLSNGSVLDYLVAGTKKGNAGLGRSRALNFVHATEMSSWGDPESLASLKAAMAQKHPNRLYIFESTAKGFNLFYEMWENAKVSPSSQKPIFLGWWSKDDYSLPASDKRFQEFWDGILSENEKDTAAQVLEFYAHAITPEQWAWYRWYEATESTGEGMMQQEFPSTEEEAFISTGTSFFPRHKISADLKRLHERKPLFKAYKYHIGEDFAATEIQPVDNSYEAELRVWEPPNPQGEYIIGIDPAYGRNDNKDRHAIEIYRCFADRLIQVAEYATHNPETYQAAWVVAHLAGWYRNVVLMLEQQGPGLAIHREIKHLRQLMDAGKILPENGQGLQNVFGNVRWFVYNRYDSMGGGSGVYNWITNVSNKVTIMNQLRDAYATNQLDIRSLPLMGEMQTIEQDGSNIEASGRNKDDRVFATALVNRAWIDIKRPTLITLGKTYEAEMKKEAMIKTDPRQTLVGNVVAQFYAQQESARSRARVERLAYKPPRKR